MSGQKFFRLKKWALTLTGSYLYEIIRHTVAHRRVPRLANPVTFNDKVGHRKIYEAGDDYAFLADKAAVRSFVAKELGRDFLPALYFCGDDVEEIELDDLPESFVLKATHGSGKDFIHFVDDKEDVREERLKDVARELLARRYGEVTNEWWYGKIKPQVIIEEMLKDETFGIPIDYKLFVFHGEVRIVQVDYSRFQHHTRTFYDLDWQPLAFTFKYPRGPVTSRPKLFSEMVEAAECLGRAFDFVRIDLYCVNDERLAFGEVTLAPEAGWGRFSPRKWDKVLGEMW